MLFLSEDLSEVFGHRFWRNACQTPLEIFSVQWAVRKVAGGALDRMHQQPHAIFRHMGTIAFCIARPDKYNGWNIPYAGEMLRGAVGRDQGGRIGNDGCREFETRFSSQVGV